MVKIENPILKGFNPDPCICKANGTYYIATSTFEWFPGVQIYESCDLVNWEFKCAPLNNIEYLDLKGIPDSAGIWAPALSFYEDTFYLVYTISKQIDGYFKDVENYVIISSNIDGPWSKPIFINGSGFDPSMYHENGKHYVLNPQWDYRPLEGHKKFNGLILQEFDFNEGMIGESKVVFTGSGTGGTEGPHLMKKDDYYYIIAAEGGTGRHHSICVARSKSIWGPYEVSPYHPLITAWEKDTILKKSGHGNFVETDDGEWYMTHLCSRYLDNKDVCVLGRESAIQKIEWIDGWPRMVQGDNTPAVIVEAPKCAREKQEESKAYQTSFNIHMDMVKEGWMSLRTPFDRKSKLTDSGLIVKGGDSLTSLYDQSLIARRWDSFKFSSETCVQFNPYHYSQMAGLTCYYNTKVWHFLYVGYDEKVKKRIVNVLTNDNFSFNEPLKGDYIYLEDTVRDVYLKVEVEQENLQFYYAFDNKEYKAIGPILDASILSDEHVAGWAYTGAFNGITAIDVFNKDTSAIFTWFKQENEEI
jgi:xylan 1,4-beta-xylosidase